MGERHPNVVNVDELPWGEGMRHGNAFACRAKRLGAAAGGKRLGCSIYEVEPGKRAFPKHAHLANDEAIFVLEGQGTLRVGDRDVPVRAGDYIAFPAGPASAHQLVNTSSGMLRYLCMSTMLSPEVALYPDSGKLGVLGGEADPSLRAVIKGSAVGGGMADYFDGEPID